MLLAKSKFSRMMEQFSTDDNEVSSLNEDENTEAAKDNQANQNQIDDFDIDTSLDADPESDNGKVEDPTKNDPGMETNGGSEDGIDDLDSNEDIGGEDNAPGGDQNETPEEPVEANTDMFQSLSKEEQVSKLKEMKKQYKELYSSCDDMFQKLSDINLDGEQIEVISRISDSIFKLKEYIANYMVDRFPYASNYENDVMFNRFCTILDTNANIIDTLAKKKEAKSKET